MLTGHMFTCRGTAYLLVFEGHCILRASIGAQAMSTPLTSVQSNRYGCDRLSSSFRSIEWQVPTEDEKEAASVQAPSTSLSIL